MNALSGEHGESCIHLIQHFYSLRLGDGGSTGAVSGNPHLVYAGLVVIEADGVVDEVHNDTGSALAKGPHQAVNHANGFGKEGGGKGRAREGVAVKLNEGWWRNQENVLCIAVIATKVVEISGHGLDTIRTVWPNHLTQVRVVHAASRDVPCGCAAGWKLVKVHNVGGVGHVDQDIGGGNKTGHWIAQNHNVGGG